MRGLALEKNNSFSEYEENEEKYGFTTALNQPDKMEQPNETPTLKDIHLPGYMHNLKLYHMKEVYDMEEELLVVEGSMFGVKIRILIDGGAAGNFIKKETLSKLPTQATSNFTKYERPIYLADDSIIQSSTFGKLPFSIGKYKEKAEFITAPIAYDVILGKPWLTLVNPQINWRTNEVKIVRKSSTYKLNCTSTNKLKVDSKMISALQFKKLIKKKSTKAWLCVLKSEMIMEIEKQLNEIAFKNIADQNEKDKEIYEALSPQLKKLLDKYPKVFSEYKGLPPERPNTDHTIELEPGSTPTFKNIYPMSQKELETLKKELIELLSSGRIRPSTSPYGAPVFFVYTEEKMRLVVDYRALNKISVKNRAALPNIQEILDRLSKAKFFTKLDLASGFHQILINENDCKKTAFRTKYGHFEWTVMPFGLSNAPATFQNTMNSVFRDFIDIFVTVYIDDILIYSDNLEEHIEHLEKVLKRLEENQFHVRLHKCSFLLTELEYLGYKIGQNKISVLESRIQDIKEFPLPQTATLLRSFLGLANTVHRFVPNQASLLADISELLKSLPTKAGSNAAVHWTPELERKFYHIRNEISNPQVLAVFDPEKEIHLFSDWSKSGIGSFVGQIHDDVLRPIAFHSRKCNDAERKYHPYHGEIMALVEALKVHRHYLYGQVFKSYVDHQSLRHILNQNKLKPLHQRWLTDLLAFDFFIEWIPGEWNFVSDILSRNSFVRDIGVSTEDKSEEHIEKLPVLLNSIIQLQTNLLNQIREQQSNDESIQEIIACLPQSSININALTDQNIQKPRIPKHLVHLIKHYSVQRGLLYFDDKLVIPKCLRKEIFALAHTNFIHNSWIKVTERIMRNFYWSSMSEDIQKFCRNCDSCQRNKTPRRLPYGLLHPLPVPERKGEILSVDFMSGFSESNGYNALTVWVDFLTKRVWIYPCKKIDDTYQIAQDFLKHVYRESGLPRALVSDRDPRFISSLWEEICKSLNIEQRMSTAYHPQSDGQTENKNGWILEILRSLVHHNQTNWSEKLHFVEFGINDSINASTGYSPFYLWSGQNPNSILDLALPPRPPLSLDDIQSLLKIVRNKIQRSQHLQALYANRKRLEDPFQIGDYVLLSSKHHLPPAEFSPLSKISPRFTGPYKIIQKISDSYKLDLPATWSIHPVFHVEKLRPYYYDGPDPLRHLPVFQRQIEEVLTFRRIGATARFPRGRIQYLVKWLNHNRRFNCWLNEEHVPEIFRIAGL